MAFIRRSGVARCSMPSAALREGKQLRVLTTTYTGSTEGRALDELSELGADVRVSYDMSTTRLHAKAWLFHRAEGFSTAYIGSSNLTHSAQVSGLEWNVRVSGARNPDVIDKVAAVFESYWDERRLRRRTTPKSFASNTARFAASGHFFSVRSSFGSDRSRSVCSSRSRSHASMGTIATCSSLQQAQANGHGRDRLRAPSRSPPTRAPSVRGAS